MKLSILPATTACFLPAFAWSTIPPRSPHLLPWAPAGPHDVRSPCPMLNTLANHDFLPHDGKDITEENTIWALQTALNIEEDLAQLLFQGALKTNPAPNATTFSLDNLNRHGILEHDASLSRADFYFGDNHSFNQTVFDETRSYWTAPVIDIDAAATARQARVNTSQATNPSYNMSQLGEALSFGETGIYILALGDKIEGTVDRSWVEYFFENERLPIELGWVRHEQTISTSDLESMVQRVMNSTGTTTVANPN